jgi:hypothetical protein
MPLTSRDDSHLFDKYKMLFRLQVGAALGCLFIILYALQYLGIGFLGLGSAMRIASVGLLAAGAALFLGFLLGFIFCIPRTAKPAGTAAASSSVEGKESIDAGPHTTAVAISAVETNTNLVEISDWLTKILVGVGLVELNKIPSGLRRLGQFLAPGLRECDSTSCIGSSEAFAIGIVIFFFGAGFLIGYLWTRLYFQRAVSELAELAHRVEKAWVAVTRAEVAVNSGQLDEGMRLVDDALVDNPSNARAVFLKGRILKRLAQVDGPPGNPALLREAFEYASRAAILLPNQGGPLYNMACYQALLGINKADVLNNLRRAVELNPRLREEARKDSDLVSLWDDAEFKRITNPAEHA